MGLVKAEVAALKTPRSGFSTRDVQQEEEKRPQPERPNNDVRAGKTHLSMSNPFTSN